MVGWAIDSALPTIFARGWTTFSSAHHFFKHLAVERNLAAVSNHYFKHRAAMWNLASLSSLAKRSRSVAIPLFYI